MTKEIWTFIFRAAGLGLGVCAAVFLSVSPSSSWKTSSGVACGIFGTIFMIAMHFAKKTDGAENVHLVNRELNHYPPADIDHHD